MKSDGLYLKLKPFVKLIEAESHQLVLTQLGQRVLMKSPQAEKMASAIEYLETLRSKEDLIQFLTPEWSEENTLKFIKVLEQQKLITYYPEERNNVSVKTTSSWQRFSESFTDSFSEVSHACELSDRIEVLLLSEMALDDNFLKAAKRESFKFNFDHATSNQVFIVISSSLDFLNLEKLSSKVFSSKAKVIPVLLDPFGAIVGPYITGESGYCCLNCVSVRLQSNIGNLNYIKKMPQKSLQDVVGSWPETFWQRLESIVREELFKLIGKVTYSSLERGAYIFDFLNHRSQFEDVFPVPGCSCSLGIQIEEKNPMVIPL